MDGKVGPITGVDRVRSIEQARQCGRRLERHDPQQPMDAIPNRVTIVGSLNGLRLSNRLSAEKGP